MDDVSFAHTQRRACQWQVAIQVMPWQVFRCFINYVFATMWRSSLDRNNIEVSWCGPFQLHSDKLPIGKIQRELIRSYAVPSNYVEQGRNLTRWMWIVMWVVFRWLISVLSELLWAVILCGVCHISVVEVALLMWTITSVTHLPHHSTTSTLTQTLAPEIDEFSTIWAEVYQIEAPCRLSEISWSEGRAQNTYLLTSITWR